VLYVLPSATLSATCELGVTPIRPRRGSPVGSALESASIRCQRLSAEHSPVTALGREPTAEEIADVTGIEPDEVESIKRSAQAPISLEKPVGDEEESEFGQFIADEQAESPYERAVEILTKEALRDALENLSYRERRVLELRYGLGGEHPCTLDEVGRTFNVTRERIRQIENQSLKKLQNLREAQQLRDDGEIASGYALPTRGHRT
jgi:RNA polymerase primary sigma factor